MMATYEDMMAKAKQLHAAGDTEKARRLAQIALSRKNEAPSKPPGERVKQFFLGDNDPTTQNLGEKIGTALNKAGESMTFGLLGDEASAAVESLVPGVNYEDRRDHYRQQERLLEESNPGVALTADVGGAVTGALLPLGAAGTLARGARVAPRVAASMATGTAGAGTYGFAEGEGLEDRINQGKGGAMLGAGVGMAAPLLGAGVQKVADSRAANRMLSKITKNAPTTEQLRAMGRAGYKAIDDADVQIKPSSFSRARSDIIDALRSDTGFDELPGPGSLTPKTARVMQIMGKASDEMATDPTAALPFKSLDQMRRQAGAAAGNVTEKADQHAGMKVIEGLDDFVNRLGPDDVVQGDVKRLPELVGKARELWSIMSKSQKIDDAMEAAESYRWGAGNGIKWQFKKILQSPKLSRGFSDAEKKTMQRVIDGTVPEKLLETLGSGLASVGGMAGGTISALMGNPALAAAGLGATGVSMLARRASNNMARKNAEIVRALVASGGVPQLPVASDGSRKIVESLMRRGAAIGAQ